MPGDDPSPAALAELRAVPTELVENRGLAARTAGVRGIPELLELHDDTIAAGWRVLTRPTVGNLLAFRLDQEEAVAAAWWSALDGAGLPYAASRAPRAPNAGRWAARSLREPERGGPAGRAGSRAGTRGGRRS